MRMKLSRKGLLAQIIKPESDALSDRSTVQWMTSDLKAPGVIAGDDLLNRNTLKNRLIVTKKLHNFKMESGTRFAVHVDQFKEIVLHMETIGEPLDETRQLVLLLEGVRGEKAFVAKKSYDKRRFNGKCFYCKKPVHKETECRKKKADEERGQVARETSDYAFTATSAMGKTEWLVDSGARSHMTSVRDKFVSMKEQKTPVRITIADGRKIDAVAMGTVGLKLMDGTSTTLSGVCTFLKSKEASSRWRSWPRRTIVAQFSKDKCVFRCGDATVMVVKRCGNVYKLETVGGRGVSCGDDIS
ncbi:hypothetical protein PF002_g30514 [Phytophthora fragariae]|uniref:Retrovirus-related Pol polyprotein from transposon TNT 1-94-like beta-barrel domain-containing protein n=2 Tax=Phytophthora fragariae TaxID=53985 RepID=A0A6A3VWE8_9STRA|nr:hypothetical protein PF002_g30514 [Phytophthora fragariae]